MRCFSIIPFLVAFSEIPSKKIYTFVAFDERIATAYNFYTNNVDTIDFVRKTLHNYGFQEAKVPKNRKEGALTLCHEDIGTAFGLHRIFNLLVKHHKIGGGSQLGQEDVKCLNFLMKTVGPGKDNRLSSIFGNDNPCTQKIIPKLIGHGFVVLEGKYSCIRIAQRNIENIPKLDANIPLTDEVFDKEKELFVWQIFPLYKKSAESYAKLVLRHIDSRPVLVLYRNYIKMALAISHIEPEDARIVDVYRKHLVLHSKEAYAVHGSLFSSYSVGAHYGEIGTSIEEQ